MGGSRSPYVLFRGEEGGGRGGSSGTSVVVRGVPTPTDDLEVATVEPEGRFRGPGFLKVVIGLWGITSHGRERVLPDQQFPAPVGS